VRTLLHNFAIGQTKIRSAMRTVEKRCEISTAIRPRVRSAKSALPQVFRRRAASPATSLGELRDSGWLFLPLLCAVPDSNYFNGVSLQDSVDHNVGSQRRNDELAGAFFQAGLADLGTAAKDFYSIVNDAANSVRGDKIPPLFDVAGNCLEIADRTECPADPSQERCCCSSHRRT